MGLLLIVLVLRVLLRREWLAIAVFLAITFAVGFLSEDHAFVTGVSNAFLFGALIFILTRFGLFTGLVGVVFSSWSSFALTLDPSSWYFGRTVVTLLVFAALAIYGFVISLGGQSIFKDSVFDEPA